LPSKADTSMMTVECLYLPNRDTDQAQMIVIKGIDIHYLCLNCFSRAARQGPDCVGAWAGNPDHAPAHIHVHSKVVGWRHMKDDFLVEVWDSLERMDLPNLASNSCSHCRFLIESPPLSVAFGGWWPFQAIWDRASESKDKRCLKTRLLCINDSFEL